MASSARLDCLRNSRIPQPTKGHADLLNEFLALAGVHANLVPDPHLATLTLEHGLTLCSSGGDFALDKPARAVPLFSRLSVGGLG